MATSKMHKNLVKFNHTVSELCEWTDTSADRSRYSKIMSLQRNC